MNNQVETFEAKLYVGKREGYKGPVIRKSRLLMAIKVFQKKSEENVACLRVTKTSYIIKDYYEEGYEIAAINYPRFPKAHSQIEAMMRRLGKHLLNSLKQNRVTLVLPDVTVPFESPDAEENP